MADEPKKEDDAPVVVAAPVVEAAPAPEPVPVVEAAPAPEPVPAAEPVVEKPAQAELALVAPERKPSLLEAAEAPGEKKEETKAEPEKKADDKPAETAKVEEKPKEAEPEKKAEEPPKAPEAPKLEPIEYEKHYKVPEILILDDARKGEFHGAMDAFRSDPTTGAQKLMDLHAKALTEYAERTSKEQHRIFDETKAKWREQVQADEMIGGAGHRTAMGAIAMVRNMFVSDHQPGSKQYKSDLAELVNALDATGAGDNPAILKLIYRVSRYVNEPAPPVILDAKPVPQGGKGKGADALYDNDRSPVNGRQ